MFSAVARIFRTPDLRRKIAFTLGIIALFRLGSFIPAPFVDFENVQAVSASATRATQPEVCTTWSTSSAAARC